MIGAPIGMATKLFADFDDQMRIVQAVSGSTGKAFEQLTDKALELGRTTSFTASQVAQGMAGLGRAGFNSREIDESIASVMAL
ncbi:MAG: phage tail tape measure protein, partial [Thermoguttaceae bacterium]|nr:phage tail tape measure protein [Thermoguttaceae bacterium]